MQDDKVLKWLLDIRSAIVEIESFLSENQQGFSGLQQRSMFKRALERNIEIIGEAVNRILLVEPNVAITTARRIVDTRNFITHEYEKVSEEVLWSIVIRHIPLLKGEIDDLIAQRSG